MSYFTSDFYERNDLPPDTDPALCAAEKEIVSEPETDEPPAVVCAWCGKQMAEGSVPVSHGMCADCFTKGL